MLKIYKKVDLSVRGIILEESIKFIKLKEIKYSIE